MLTPGLVERLSSLKLHGMAKALEDILNSSSSADLDFEDRLTLMIDHEEAVRANRSMQRRLAIAKFRYPEAAVEDVDFRHKRCLSRTSFLALARCDWVKSGYNLILTGKTGLGKSWLACALGQRACREGFSVRYLRVPKLMDMMKAARGDGTAPRLTERLGKTQLLILDDFAMYPLDSDQRRDLMEIVEDRAQRRSTIITSQLDVKDWHRAFGDPTLADALLDRFVNSAYRIELDGGSMRGKQRPPELSP
jgi:DNA replication protein DnaC